MGHKLIKTMVHTNFRQEVELMHCNMGKTSTLAEINCCKTFPDRVLLATGVSLSSNCVDLLAMLVYIFLYMSFYISLVHAC